MWQGMLFPLLLVLQSCDILTSEVFIVSKCPCGKSEWQKQEREMNCNGKKYTCIETVNGTMIECCILPYRFKQSVGCPYVETITPSDGPLIAIKHTECNVSGCPSKDHVEFSINEMYKYPACLIPVRQRLTIKSSSDVDQLCSLSKATAEETPTNDSKIFIIQENHVPITPTILVCLVTLACFTMATAFIIVVIRRQRYRSTRKPMEEGLDSAFKEYINYANGLAWSHYTGFLIKLLPVLEDAIKGSKTFKEHPDRTSTLWIMLCPKSGMSSRLEDDDSITVEESLSIPGIKQPIDILRIQRNELEKPWFCCLEFPSSLMSLAKDPVSITKETISLEVRRFTFYMMNILNHENNKQCKGRGTTIYYDDGEQKEGSAISKVILRQLESVQSPFDENSNIPDVCMLYDGEQKGKKRYLDFENAVSRSCRPSILDLRSHDKRIIIKVLAQSRWIVLYNIEDEIRYKYPWLLKCLEEMVHTGTSDIIAIYSGKSQEEWTKCIPWTIAIDIDKECYAAEKVQNIINGKAIELATDITIGDLSFGLAWAFYVNYLKPVTHDLDDRVTEVLNEELKKSGNDGTAVKSSNFFWQIIPTSCSCVPLNEIDDDISSPIVVKPLKTKMYGAQRVFPCDLYSIKRGNTVYYFVGEIFTPCRVLKAMKESSMVHLSDAAFKKQLRQLKQTLKDLVKCVGGINPDALQVKIVYFEDRRYASLSDLLIKSIESEEIVDFTEVNLLTQHKYSLSAESESILQREMK